jgi:hypothetical protein
MSGRFGDWTGAVSAVAIGAALLFSCVGLAYAAAEVPDAPDALTPFFAPGVFCSLAGLAAAVLAVAAPEPGVIRSILALVAGLLVLWGMEGLTRPFDVFYAYVDVHSAAGFGLTAVKYLVSGAVTGWCVAHLARVLPYGHALALGLPLAALLAYGLQRLGFTASPLGTAAYFVAYAAPFVLGAWLAAGFDPRGALFRTRAG